MLKSELFISLGMHFFKKKFSEPDLTLDVQVSTGLELKGFSTALWLGNASHMLDAQYIFMMYYNG